MDVSEKALARQKFRSSHRGRGRGRGGRGAGGGAAGPRNAQADLGTNEYRYEDSEEPEEGVVPPKSTGADFEALVEEVEAQFSQSHYRFRSFQQELEADAPSLGATHPDQILAINLQQLAASLSSLPLHTLLGLEPEYTQELEEQQQPATSAGPTAAASSSAGLSAAGPRASTTAATASATMPATAARHGTAPLPYQPTVASSSGPAPIQTAYSPLHAAAGTSGARGTSGTDAATPAAAVSPHLLGIPPALTAARGALGSRQSPAATAVAAMPGAVPVSGPPLAAPAAQAPVAPAAAVAPAHADADAADEDGLLELLLQGNSPAAQQPPISSGSSSGQPAAPLPSTATPTAGGGPHQVAACTAVHAAPAPGLHTYGASSGSSNRSIGAVPAGVAGSLRPAQILSSLPAASSLATRAGGATAPPAGRPAVASGSISKLGTGDAELDALLGIAPASVPGAAPGSTAPATAVTAAAGAKLPLKQGGASRANATLPAASSAARLLPASAAGKVSLPPAAPAAPGAPPKSLEDWLGSL